MRQKALIVLGPSGAGKSTLIDELLKRNKGFVAIPAYTTRQKRTHDPYRISISSYKFHQIKQTEKLLLLNFVYGTWYGTPQRLIEEAFNKNLLPVFDCPLKKLAEVRQALDNRVFSIYVAPPSLEILLSRLGGRGAEDARFRTALEEINDIREGVYNSLIDRLVISKDGMLKEIADEIHISYLKSII